MAVAPTTGHTAPAAKLGIIGAGQLGMLLCRAARELGVSTTVLSPDALSPAIHEADEIIIAAMDDAGALEQLILSCDALTFEFEAVPAAALQTLQGAASSGRIRVNPDTEILSALQDKATQKRWLHRNNLPTLPFTLTGPGSTPEDILDGDIPLPLVQKTRRGGYDGKGVQILRTREDLDRLWPVPGLIEPALENCTEVSVVVASNCRGHLVAYPPVSMTFDDTTNAVSVVTCPAALNPAAADLCSNIARDAVALLGGAGVFAVELFVTPGGDVTINEVSPRVHNSGHLTMDAFRHCQFEQHVRATTGLPLAPALARSPAAVMLNLLYDESLAPALSPHPYSAAMDEHGYAHLHWYGKCQPRPGRKMGHITALGMSANDAYCRAAEALARLREGHIPQDRTESGALAL